MAVHVANTEDLTRPPVVSVTPDTLPNDLEITDLVVGSGLLAGPRDTVQVQYQGVRVADGGEFDSSWARGGAPVEFPLGQVIDGFKLGISGMREGGRRVLVVPPRHGYGAQGVPPGIPSNAHLVFVVDLVRVVDDSRGSGTQVGLPQAAAASVDRFPSRRAAVFVSYRRADTGHVAGRISDVLASRYGEDLVFVDVNSIEPGLDFVDAIVDAIERSVLVLVFIGPDWDERAADGRRRILDVDDVVRIEIEQALSRGKRVVPVLVDTATMPRSTELPRSLTSLATRNAIALRHATFRQDATVLLELVEKVLGSRDSIA